MNVSLVILVMRLHVLMLTSVKQVSHLAVDGQIVTIHLDHSIVPALPTLKLTPVAIALI